MPDDAVNILSEDLIEGLEDCGVRDMFDDDYGELVDDDEYDMMESLECGGFECVECPKDITFLSRGTKIVYFTTGWERGAVQPHIW